MAVGAVVGATVGGTAVGGTAVGGTAVGAWVAGATVGAVVAWAQELNTSELKTITESNTNRIFFFTFFLLIMDKNMALGGLMNTRLVTVDPQEKVGAVTSIFKKYKFLALPVADEAGILRGIITLKDIMQEELDE